MNKEVSFIFIDLESTGLIEGGNFPMILEIGLIATNSQFEEISTYHALVQPTEDPKGLACDFVKEMHTMSGLWNDLEAKDLNDTENVCKQMCEWVDSLGLGDVKVPLAGNSLGQFDIALLRQKGFAEFLAKVHYRSLDASSLRLLFESKTDNVWPKSEGNTKHRVMEDIRASIQQVLFFDENY